MRPSANIQQLGADIDRLCAEQGITREQAFAQLLAPVELEAASEVVSVGRRPRNITSEPIPEHMIPTRERLMEHYEAARRQARVSAEEASGFRLAIERFRISKMMNSHDLEASDAPLQQMEGAGESMVEAHLIPCEREPIVEFGQTAYVRYNEDEKRPEFARFIKDIESGIYDGMVLVVQRIDRLCRTVSQGSKLLEALEDHKIDIFEFAEDDRVYPLKEREGKYIADFQAAKNEWEKTRTRARDKRQWKINRGDLAGVGGGIGHMERRVRNSKGIVKVEAYLPDAEYQPYVVEVLTRCAAHESEMSICVDLNGRADRGEGLYPPPWMRRGKLVYTTWQPKTLKSIIRSARMIGCQFNSKGDPIRCLAIEPLVRDQLWLDANVALDKMEAERKEKGFTGGGNPGPNRVKIGVRLVACGGCTHTGHAGSNALVCGKPQMRNRKAAGPSSPHGAASDGRWHFALADHIYVPMLREVALGILDHYPEIAAQANEQAATNEKAGIDIGKLRRTYAVLQESRATITDLAAGDPTADPDDLNGPFYPKIDMAEAEARYTSIDATMREISEKIAKSHTAKKKPLGSLLPGETFRSRWSAEEARPNRDGTLWINELLGELFESVTIKTGPEWRGNNAFHEARFDFVGKGFQINPEFVAEVADRLYQARLATIRDIGQGELPQTLRDLLWQLHYVERKGATKIKRELDVLAADDADYRLPKPTSAQKLSKYTGNWSLATINYHVAQEYARRGVEFLPCKRQCLTPDDRRLMKELADAHGLDSAISLVNKLAKPQRSNKLPWDERTYRAAIEVDPNGPGGGRPRALSDEHLALGAQLQRQGKTVAQILVCLASLPQPVKVSYCTLHRRLREQRLASGAVQPV